MKHSTPIIDSVRAMHREEDAGRDPYNTTPRRRFTDPVRPSVTSAQVREAAQNLKCYETVLELQS